LHHSTTFVSIKKSKGATEITFTAAGSIACLEVEFNPMLGHIHMSPTGTNRPRRYNYSSLKSGEGQFYGCLPTECITLQATTEDVLDLLPYPQM
jgi:hypothetical protein